MFLPFIVINLIFTARLSSTPEAVVRTRSALNHNEDQAPGLLYCYSFGTWALLFCVEFWFRFVKLLCFNIILLIILSALVSFFFKLCTAAT